VSHFATRILDVVLITGCLLFIFGLVVMAALL
jgi:hypothetical protein